MSLSLRLDLRQSQSLVMTPQLQQAIKLLQLPNLELAAYVTQELEQNPFLEPAEAADDGAPGSEDEPEPDTRSAELTGSLVMAAGEAPGGSPGSADDGWADPQRDGLALDGFAQIGRGGSLDFADAGPDLEARLSQPRGQRDGHGHAQRLGAVGGVVVARVDAASDGFVLGLRTGA